MKNQACWLLPLLLLFSACGADAALPESRLAIVPSPAPAAEEGAATVWWIHLGEQSSASFWLGPVMLDEFGESTRLWTLVCHVPGYERPLACRQHRVEAAGTDPVVLDCQDIGVTIKPRGASTWADVQLRDHLETSIRGFF
jgi:hypothetical protein